MTLGVEARYELTPHRNDCALSSMESVGVGFLSFPRPLLVKPFQRA